MPPTKRLWPWPRPVTPSHRANRAGDRAAPGHQSTAQRAFRGPLSQCATRADTQGDSIDRHGQRLICIPATSLRPRSCTMPSRSSSRTITRDATPSAEDKEVTQRLKDAGRLLGIAVMQHIIITAYGYSGRSESLSRTGVRRRKKSPDCSYRPAGPRPLSPRAGAGVSHHPPSSTQECTTHIACLANANRASSCCVQDSQANLRERLSGITNGCPLGNRTSRPLIRCSTRQIKPSIR